MILPAPNSSSSTSSGRIAPEPQAIVVPQETVNRLHREQNKTQDLLGSLSYALRSFNNLNQFLDLIPLVASRVVDAHGAVLFLFKPNGQISLALMHCPQENPQFKTIRKALDLASRQFKIAPLPTDSNVPGSTLPGDDASFTAKALDLQLSRNLGAGVRCFGTPIFFRNQERGRLYVFSTSPSYDWSLTRQKLVRLVADQTAVAIANEELKKELRSRERLDRELEIGAEIQRQLLPRQCPNIPGMDVAARCQTANQLGGDYYDFFSPTNYGSSLQPEDRIDRWGVAIGDVMGKGIPAGLIMTMTRGMLRSEVLNGRSPADILQHLNRVYYADLEKAHRFVTLFYAEYNPQQQLLSYSNAAHHPPLLWQAETNVIKRLDTVGMLIGLDAQTLYHNGHTYLYAGDVLLFYTDGITDAANPQGDRYDDERLLQSLRWACHHLDSAQAILQYLLDQVQSFMGRDQKLQDDMTLVVMKVTSTRAEVSHQPVIA